MVATRVLVLCGPAGMGKSSTAYEVSRRLVRDDVPHAVVDSDELEMVHPWPPAGQAPSGLSRRNLAAVWANFAALGHTRLLVTGVFADLPSDLSWISAAVPDAEVTAVRLTADPSTLRARVHRRAVGSAAEHQLARSLGQLDRIGRTDPPWATVVDTTALPVTAVAARVVDTWWARPHG